MRVASARTSGRWWSLAGVTGIALCVGSVWYGAYWEPHKALAESCNELITHQFEVDVPEELKSCYCPHFLLSGEEEGIEISRSLFTSRIELEEVEGALTELANHVRAFRCPSVAVDDDHVKILSQCTHIRALEVDATRMTNRGASMLQLSSLAMFWFSAPAVTDEGLTWLSDCDDLVIVRLDGTAVTSRTVEGLNPDSLKVLGLNDCQVTNDVLDAIARMSELEYLHLAHTQLNDEASVAFEQMLCRSNLKVVDLSFTDIGDATARVLATFPRVMEVRITGSAVTDHGIDALRSAGITVY